MPAVELSKDELSQTAHNWTQPPIDSGGFSTLYTGHFFRRDVVVKVLTIRNPQELEMFTEELRVLLDPALDHPNLVPLVAYCRERPALVFPHLKPMKQDRMQRLPLDVREAIALDAAKGVGHMHSKGYVHRDIKPDNVLLEFDSNRRFVKACIADMGCVVRPTVPVRPFGSMLYMDPHLLGLMQANADVVAVPLPTNDIYSLALTIACILCARPAHAKPDFDFMVREIDAHDTMRSAFLMRMMDPLHVKRPTAEQVVEYLTQLAGKPRVPRSAAGTAAALPPPQPVQVVPMVVPPGAVVHTQPLMPSGHMPPPVLVPAHYVPQQQLQVPLQPMPVATAPGPVAPQLQQLQHQQHQLQQLHPQQHQQQQQQQPQQQPPPQQQLLDPASGLTTPQGLTPQGLTPQQQPQQACPTTPPPNAHLLPASANHQSPLPPAAVASPPPQQQQHQDPQQQQQQPHAPQHDQQQQQQHEAHEPRSLDHQKTSDKKKKKDGDGCCCS